jgi:hypothetical protein
MLKSIDFVESLPRLFIGKIDKKVLRAPYWQGQERQVSLAALALGLPLAAASSEGLSEEKVFYDHLLKQFGASLRCRFECERLLFRISRPSA